MSLLSKYLHLSIEIQTTSNYTQGQQAEANIRRPVSVDDDSGIAVFNYHEYIESTRRAH